jgi:hydrogenase maturation protease
VKSRTCLLGLGNILMQDDGIGVHAVQAIEQRFRFTPEIDIVDGGTLGLSLLPLIEGYGRVLFVDAVDAGLEPGTIVVREGDEVPIFLGSHLSVHQAGLADLLYAARMAGAMPPEVCLAGIQPQAVGLGLETTSPVKGHTEELIRTVLTMLDAWGIRADARGTVTNSP